MASVAQPVPGRRGRKPETKSPVLKVTKYDLTSAFMIAIVVALILALLWVIALWLANRRVKVESEAELEYISLAGGEPDGAPDETLKVDSPAELSDDPAVADSPETEPEVQEIVENVLEQSDNAAKQVVQQFDTGAQNTGKAGRADGTGRPALGDGGRGAGLAPYQRWLIAWDKSSLKEYARQLDYFDIEVGMLRDQGGKRDLIYLKNMSTSPKTRNVSSGKDDRLRFNWKGGARRKADIGLFKEARVNTGGALLTFHFYSGPTVTALLKAEKAKATKPIKQIRRTYFIVRKRGSGYEFVVTRITYF